MNPATLYWNGNVETFQHAIGRRCPLRRLAHQAIWTHRRDIDALHADPVFNFYRTHNVSQEIIAVSAEAVERAATSMERLQEVVDKFRSNTANDLKSMKAVSDRVQTEVNSMTQSYNQAVQLLTSEAFERAIANAERLVTAMRAINELQSTRVVLQMFDNVDVKGANDGN